MMDGDGKKLQPDTLEWFTLRELALRWRTSVETLRRQCDSGELTAMRLGHQWRVHESVVKDREGKAQVKMVAKAREQTFAGSGVDHIG
jgi:excisionase family DNA binding protein